MGKQGPCCHCGVASTPLWRNGPPGKPVLCNACGSRWRTKGTLANYAPLHSLGFVPVDSDDWTSCDFKSPLKKKLQILDTRKQNECSEEARESVSQYGPSVNGFQDFTGNRSCSGSVISLSESCVELGGMGGNVFSGTTQPYLWDSQVPSCKRTRNKRKSPSSAVEKLRRDLYDILKGQESLDLSGSSDEVLLYEKEEDPMISVEIGLGTVLIKQPASSAEEESEATSLALENKMLCLNDSYVESLSFRVRSSAGGKHEEILDVGESKVSMENVPNLCFISNTSL